MKLQKCFKFTGEEQFFQGHFPGMPVLPGVIQLQFAVRAARELLGGERVLKTAKKVKFSQVIVPGEAVTLEVEGTEPVDSGLATVEYKWWKGDVICASGVLLFV